MSVRHRSDTTRTDRQCVLPRDMELELEFDDERDPEVRDAERPIPLASGNLTIRVAALLDAWAQLRGRRLGPAALLFLGSTWTVLPPAGVDGATGRLLSLTKNRRVGIGICGLVQRLWDQPVVVGRPWNTPSATTLAHSV